MDFKVLTISLNQSVVSLFSLPLNISSTVVFHTCRHDGCLSCRTFMLFRLLLQTVSERKCFAIFRGASLHFRDFFSFDMLK